MALVWPSLASAYCRLTTDMPRPGECSELGVGLEWRRSCISYSLTPRQSGEPPFEAVRDAADTAFATWTEVRCDGRPLPLGIAQTQELATCGEPEYSTRGPNANAILFVHDWRARELPAEAFGLTLVWHDPNNGEIFDTDMQINETLGRLSICDDGCPHDGVDLRNVITHEAGHFLGLGHTGVRGATMSARAELGETHKRSLEEDDIEGICRVYGDRAAPACTEADFQPDRGFTAECVSAPGTASACACSAPGSPTRSRAPGALGCALVLCLLLRRRIASYS